MPVLNWDTKAPVDWTGSPLQTLMSRGRGATLVAAALQRSITVPESQVNTTAASGSPKVGRAGRSTPEKEKLPMPKRNPPRQKKGTPDRSSTSAKGKKNKVPDTLKGKSRTRTASDDDDVDSNAQKDNKDPESRVASKGKEARSEDEQHSDEDASHSNTEDNPRNETDHENLHSEDSHDSQDEDIGSRNNSKNEGGCSSRNWMKTMNRPHMQNHPLQKKNVRITNTTHNTQENKKNLLKTKKKIYGIKAAITRTNTIDSQQNHVKKTAVTAPNLPQTMTVKSSRRRLCMKMPVLH